MNAGRIQANIKCRKRRHSIVKHHTKVFLVARKTKMSHMCLSCACCVLPNQPLSDFICGEHWTHQPRRLLKLNRRSHVWGSFTACSFFFWHSSSWPDCFAPKYKYEQRRNWNEKGWSRLTGRANKYERNIQFSNSFISKKVNGTRTNARAHTACTLTTASVENSCQQILDARQYNSVMCWLRLTLTMAAITLLSRRHINYFVW